MTGIEKTIFEFNKGKDNHISFNLKYGYQLVVRSSLPNVYLNFNAPYFDKVTNMYSFLISKTGVIEACVNGQRYFIGDDVVDTTKMVGTLSIGGGIDDNIYKQSSYSNGIKANLQHFEVLNGILTQGELLSIYEQGRIV